MKKLLSFIAFAGIMSAMSSFANDIEDHHAKVDNDSIFQTEDSTVAVIAWFSKNDTLTYWINESEWKVKDEDTVKTSGVATKVMITVTDSTENGFDMQYKFLDFIGDTLASSEIGKFQNMIVEKLSDKIVGTTILFKTDEYGHITEYKNLKEIKKQAKSLFKDASKELMKMPVIDSLKTIGLDFSQILKQVDTDELVKGYTEELELLFACHGNEYAIGSRTKHEDESYAQFASDTYTTISSDKETGEYEIAISVDSYIPNKYIKELVGQIVDEFDNEEINKGFNEEFDKQVKDKAIVNTYYCNRFFADGWPEEVVNQTNTMIGNQGKLQQTYIWWESRSTGNHH